MGFSFSGIVIDKKFNKENIDSFSNRFDFDKLEYNRDVQLDESLNINFDEQYLDFYTTENSTIVFCASPDLGDRMNLEKASYKGKSGFFMVDETSMNMMATLFENMEAKCQYTEIHNEVKQAFKKDFEGSLKDGFQTALDVISYVTGLDFHKLDNISLMRFNLTSGDIKLSNFDSDLNNSYQKFTQDNMDVKLDDNTLKKSKAYNSQEKFKIFRNLVSTDNEVVKAQIESLNTYGVDNITLNYILMVMLFHHDRTVKNVARKVFKSQASESLQEHIKEKWESKFVREQTVNQNKLLEHEEINVGECLCIRQVLRKNYFDLNPPKTGYNLYLDGRGGNIQDVFDSCNIPLTEFPDTFELLQHVKYVKLYKEKFFDFPSVIGKICQLPELEVLRLEEMNIENFPLEIFNLKSLKRLSIDRTEIKTIPNKGILPNLEVLQINNCSIDFLDLSMFPNIKQIDGLAEWTLERMDIINNPNDKLHIRCGVGFSTTLSTQEHYGDKKDRSKLPKDKLSNDKIDKELSPTKYKSNSG